MFRHNFKVVAAASILAVSAGAAFAVENTVLQEHELLEGGTGCLGDFCNELNTDFVEEVGGVEQAFGGAPAAHSGSAQSSAGAPSNFRSQTASFASVPNITSQNVQEQIANGVLSTEGSEEEKGNGPDLASALAAVPVPATLPLLLGALALGAALGRKRS